MKCKICSGNTLKIGLAEGVNVLKCKHCSFVFYEKMPKTYEQIYVEPDRGSHYKDLRKEKYFKTILTPYIKKNIRFLDIGCATGLTVKICKDLGADSYGIDLDPDLINWGKKTFKLDNLYSGNIEDIKFKDNAFDVIFMNHTIEHVYDLNALMEQLQKLISPKGKIIIICPNYGRIFKKEKIGGDHVNYFRNSNMIKLFNQYGFKIIKNPQTNNINYNLYYDTNHLLKNKLNLFQIWLTFVKK